MYLIYLHKNHKFSALSFFAHFFVWTVHEKYVNWKLFFFDNFFFVFF